MKKNEKRIPLRHGTAVVNKNIDKVTVDALNRMAEWTATALEELDTLRKNRIT